MSGNLWCHIPKASADARAKDSVTAFIGVGILVPQIRSCSRDSIPPFSFHIHSSDSVQRLVWTSYLTMAGKKAAGENSKKAAGNARVCFF